MNPEQDSAQTQATTPTVHQAGPDPEWSALVDAGSRGGDEGAAAVCEAYSRGIRVGIDRAATQTRTAAALVSIAESLDVLAGVAARAEDAFVETLAGGAFVQELRDEVAARRGAPDRDRDAERRR